MRADHAPSHRRDGTRPGARRVGLLSTKQFGPPVYPPQPDGIWSTVYSGDKWNTATNENRFRRAVYTYSRRTAGYPLFLTFDAPMRDFCTARRIPSNTPLQALSVMNDPAFIEMAQALANADGEGRRLNEAEDRNAGCRLLTLDKPPRATIDSLVKLYGRRADGLSRGQGNRREAR